MTDYNSTKNIEARLKAEAIHEMEKCPELKEAAENYDGGVLPIEYVYHTGLYLLNKDLVRHALDNDPELSDLRTFRDREEANYHTLNAWLGDEYAEPIATQYVVLRENCNKEQETFLWFLQWTGNEEELRKLDKYITGLGEQEFYGHTSIYSLDIAHPVSKQTAEEMCQVGLWDYMGSPNMLSGRFKGLGLNYDKPDVQELDEVFYSSLKEGLFE